MKLILQIFFILQNFLKMLDLMLLILIIVIVYDFIIIFLIAFVALGLMMQIEKNLMYHYFL
jgi:hypothetical protein